MIRRWRWMRAAASSRTRVRTDKGDQWLCARGAIAAGVASPISLTDNLQIFLRGGLKVEVIELDEIPPDHLGYPIRCGRWRKSGALFVPMLLKGGYGYAQLRLDQFFSFERRL